MAKDPAFLFYSNDFLSGTYTMSDDQVGKYVKLLCLQHQQGFLSEKDMLNICKSYDEDVYKKFIVRDGLYYNERLENEVKRRKNYSESRRNNRLGTKEKDDTYDKSYDKHMETVTIAISNISYEHKNFFENQDRAYTLNEIFEIYWKIYPNKDGKKQALKDFNASVKNVSDVYSLDKAVSNYLKTDKVKNGFIKNGSTFFNNWKDFIDIQTLSIQPEKKYTTEEYRNVFGELAE